MINITYVLLVFIGIIATLLLFSSLNPIMRLALLILIFLLNAFIYL